MGSSSCGAHRHGWRCRRCCVSPLFSRVLAVSSCGFRTQSRAPERAAGSHCLQWHARASGKSRPLRDSRSWGKDAMQLWRPANAMLGKGRRPCFVQSVAQVEVTCRNSCRKGFPCGRSDVRRVRISRVSSCEGQSSRCNVEVVQKDGAGTVVTASRTHLPRNHVPERATGFCSCILYRPREIL